MISPLDVKYQTGQHLRHTEAPCIIAHEKFPIVILMWLRVFKIFFDKTEQP